MVCSRIVLKVLLDTMNMSVRAAGDDEGQDRLRLLLQRIADVLGRPVGTFYGPDAGAEYAATIDLLDLWQAINSEQGRQAVLESARAVVAGQSE